MLAIMLKIDIIKIDAEWTKFDILKGAYSTISQFHPKPVISMWSESLIQKCNAFLTDMRYKTLLEKDMLYAM